uniref:Single VWC domain protein n=1 Tax=Eriocheir sinensis TaxID=95602 RepID=A0A173DQD4_ERISI|nr:single VWC domain protein [Eriocheir sinensis]
MGMLRAVLLTGSVLVLLVLLPAPPQAEAAATSEIVNDPDHPNTCFIKEVGIRVEEGHSFQLPGCAEVSCVKVPGVGTAITYVSCGVIAPPPGCSVLQDMSQPYPQCCEKVVCN